MKKISGWIARSSARLGKLVAAQIEGREAALLAGLALLGYGAWRVYPPAGFFLPGCVLVYVAIAGLR